MIEKNFLIADLQKQLHDADNEEIKAMLNELILKIQNGVYNIRIWE